MRNLALQLWHTLNARQRPHPDDNWEEDDNSDDQAKDKADQNYLEPAPFHACPSSLLGLELADSAEQAVTPINQDSADACEEGESDACTNQGQGDFPGTFSHTIEDVVSEVKSADLLKVESESQLQENGEETKTIQTTKRVVRPIANDDNDEFGSPFILGEGSNSQDAWEGDCLDDLPDPEDGELQEEIFNIDDTEYRRERLTSWILDTVLENCPSVLDISSQAMDGYINLLDEVQSYLDNPRLFPGILKLARRGFSFEDIYRASIVRSTWQALPVLWLYRVGATHYKVPSIKNWTAPDISWPDAALIGKAFESLEHFSSDMEVWSQQWKTLDRCSLADIAEDCLIYSVQIQFSSFVKYAVERAYAESNLHHESLNWKVAEEGEFSFDARERVKQYRRDSSNDINANGLYHGPNDRVYDIEGRIWILKHLL